MGVSSLKSNIAKPHCDYQTYINSVDHTLNPKYDFIIVNYLLSLPQFQF